MRAATFTTWGMGFCFSAMVNSYAWLRVPLPDTQCSMERNEMRIPFSISAFTCGLRDALRAFSALSVVVAAQRFCVGFYRYVL